MEINPTTQPVSFGTSGHRGLMGDAFTGSHVVAICRAVADYVLGLSESPTVMVGYDPRQGNSPDRAFGSFTQLVVDTLIENGVNVWFSDSFCPTPVVSWMIKTHTLSGGLILTASHNPPSYNGLKFNPPNGAPAPTEVTTLIQKNANEYLKNISSKTQAKSKGDLNVVDPISAFSESICTMLRYYLDGKSMDLSQKTVVVDAKHGAVGPYWEAIFSELGVGNWKVLHAEPRSDFGNGNPNPTVTKDLVELSKLGQSMNADLMIANDPDGDRHQLLDANANPISPEKTALLIAEIFRHNSQRFAGFSTTVASSRLIKAYSDQHGVAYEETKVGFKYFAPFLEKCQTLNEVGIGVESSGGLSCSFHTLEKCGFLPGLILLMGCETVSEQIQRLESQLPPSFFSEDQARFLPEKKSEILAFFDQLTLENVNLDPEFQPVSIDRTDGVKVVSKTGDWVLVRFSGTEPVARLYAEADHQQFADRLVQQAGHWISA